VQLLLPPHGAKQLHHTPYSQRRSMSVLTVSDVQPTGSTFDLVCGKSKPHPPRNEEEGGVCKAANVRLQFLALVLGECRRRSKHNRVIWLRPSNRKRNRLVPVFIDAFGEILKVICSKDG
jgi:hypothetical protein